MDGRPLYHPCFPGFTGVQNARDVASEKLPPVFQKKAWISRQCATEGAADEAVRVKLKVQWIPQEAEEPRNVEQLLRSATCSKQSHPKGEAMKDGDGYVIGAVGFNSCCEEFWFFFGLVSIPQIFSFGMALFTLCHCMLAIFNILYGL